MKINLCDICMDEAENCRKTITPQSVMTLAESIKTKGLLQPVLVMPTISPKIKEKYTLIVGFRRFKAHQILGYTEIEANVREMTKLEGYLTNFAENLDRENLNIVEEAEFISRLARLGLSRKEMGIKLGKSAGWLQPRLYLNKLPDKVKELAEAGVITADHIRTLYSCSDEEELWGLIRSIKNQANKRIKKGKIKLRRPIKTRKGRATIRKHRLVPQIDALIAHLLHKGVPFGLHTRCLAWAAGRISDSELAIDIQSFCSTAGTLYDLLLLREGSNDCLQLLAELGIDEHVIYDAPEYGFPEKGEFPEEEQLGCIDE